jgi:hypothetical protein
MEDISYIHKEEFEWLFLKWIINPSWNKIYINDIIKNRKIVFDISLSLGEDLLFNLQYIDKVNGGFIFLNKKLYHYISRERESLSNKFNPNIFEIQNRLYAEVINRCKNVYKLELKEIN